jgi:glycosyltransferase involved in cell wall biosynthesis
LNKNILYLTWDGPQVSYLEALFGPILCQLKSPDCNIQVIQFTWKNRIEIRAIKQKFCDQGIGYKSVKVIRNPRMIGAILTVIMSWFLVYRQVRTGAIDIVIVRSILPALIYLPIYKLFGIKFIYDSDGLLIDEMLEAGRIDRDSKITRVLRKMESWAVNNSSVVLARSVAGAKMLSSVHNESSIDKFVVVKNGRDSSKFKAESVQLRTSRKSDLGIHVDAPVIVYVGSLGGKYKLREMLILFQSIRKTRRDAVMLLISQSLEYFNNISDDELKQGVRAFSAKPDDIPYYLSISDLGLSLIRATRSMQAASAIKTGEYLLCGVPVVATKGVGDVSDIISRDVGYLVEDEVTDLDNEIIKDWFLGYVLSKREACRHMCRKVGMKEYSLDHAVLDYEYAINLCGNKKL